jgi:hypothetical protein
MKDIQDDFTTFKKLKKGTSHLNIYVTVVGIIAFYIKTSVISHGANPIKNDTRIT